MAKDISRQSELPIYIHLGQLWPLPEKGGDEVDPDTVIPSVVEMLTPGDVLAHPFTRHPGGFVDSKGNLHPAISEALANGIKIDVGHGSHFSFEMARKVMEAGVLPHTLGADMHGYNTKVPEPEMAKKEDHIFTGDVKFSMTHAMTELVALGMPLADVVATATSNAAEMIGMTDEIGALKPGMVADVSVLADERGKWVLRDNSGDQVVADQYLRPDFCLRAGKRFDADAIILPQLEAAA
jgi:dihydroorotase